MSRVFTKPMTLMPQATVIDPLTRRPQRNSSSTSTVYGALRHRLDDRAVDGGSVVQQEQLVYLPAGTVIEAGDVLEFDGDQWQVVGDPAEVWSHRTQSVHHLQVRVRTAKR